MGHNGHHCPPRPLQRPPRLQFCLHVQGKLHTRLIEDLIPTVTKSITLWVPFNYLNFSLIPLNYRMLSGGLVALGWNVFLSWQANNGTGAGAIKKL